MLSSEDAANHVARECLRMTEGEQLELLDGSNHSYPAKKLLSQIKGP